MTDSFDFEHIVSICLDRLRAGDALEACLASYPSHAERLGPLLHVAATLQTPEDGSLMSSEGFGAGEARLLARAAQLRARQRGPAPARRRVFSGLLAGTRRLLAASVVGVLLLCGVLSAGTVSAASTSLPGSPLYPVKRATETLVSSVAPTPQLQARVHLAWADRRLREIEALVARDGVADEALLAALGQETEQALAAAEQAGVEQLTAAAAHTEHQQAVLKRVMAKAPEAAQPGLMQALKASEKGHTRARSALERATSPGPPIIPPGQVKDKEPPGAEKDGLHPSGNGQGQGRDQDEAEDPGHGQGQGRDQDEAEDPDHGQGQGQNQDEAEDPDHGQGHGQGQGQGQDKDPNHGQGHDGSDKDELHSPGSDKGPEMGPAPGKGTGQGHGDGKRAKPDNPGQSKDKDKDKDK